MRVHGVTINPKDGEYYLAVTGAGLAVATRGDRFPEARESERARGIVIRNMGLKPVGEGDDRRFVPRFLAMETVLAIRSACGYGRKARAVKPRRPKGPKPRR